MTMTIAIWIGGSLCVAGLLALLIWALASELGSRIDLPWDDDITKVLPARRERAAIRREAVEDTAAMNAARDWDAMVGALR